MITNSHLTNAITSTTQLWADHYMDSSLTKVDNLLVYLAHPIYMNTKIFEYDSCGIKNGLKMFLNNPCIIGSCNTKCADDIPIIQNIIQLKIIQLICAFYVDKESLNHRHRKNLLRKNFDKVKKQLHKNINLYLQKYYSWRSVFDSTSHFVIIMLSVVFGLFGAAMKYVAQLQCKAALVLPKMLRENYAGQAVQIPKDMYMMHLELEAGCKVYNNISFYLLLFCFTGSAYLLWYFWNHHNNPLARLQPQLLTPALETSLFPIEQQRQLFEQSKILFSLKA